MSLLWNPLSVRRQNSSHNLSKNNLSDWFFRIFRLFIGEFDQLGLLDYVIPIWGLFKWIAYTCNTSGGITSCFPPAPFWEFIATFPKYLVAILLSFLITPIVYIINHFSTEKPRRHGLAKLLLDAQVVRIPELALIRSNDGLQAEFNNNKTLFDNQIPLRQLITAHELVNRYFLFLVVLKEGDDLRYFITLNPLKNRKSYDSNLRTILVDINRNTIFLELNFKNTLLIKQLRTHPELAIAPSSRPMPASLRYYLRHHRSKHTQVCLKVPRLICGSDEHEVNIAQIPLGLILPPVKPTSHYIISSYLSPPWSNLLIERFGPRFLLDHNAKKSELTDSYFKIISKSKVKKPLTLKEKPLREENNPRRDNLKTKKPINWLTHSLGLFLGAEKNPLTYFQQPTGPSFQESKEDSGEDFLLQILTPINKEHAAEIQAILR